MAEKPPSGNRTRGVRFELVFSPEQWAELQEGAAGEERKLADFVRRAVAIRCQRRRARAKAV